jgi:hypothetical protein
MTAQQLQIQKLNMIRYNELDGTKVVNLLASHANLWEGYVFGRFEFFTLNELRDIKTGVNADTLYLQPKHGKEDKLFALCQQFCADEVDFVNGAKAAELMGSYTPEILSNPKGLIRVWWD